MAMQLFGRRMGTIAATLVAGAVLLTSCSSAGAPADPTGGDTALTKNGAVNIQGAQGGPVDGGTLTFGGYAFPATFDTAKTQVSGFTGGTEMAAVFDVLVRYDADRGTFEPQLAKSMESADQGRTWTMGLREGVSFSDGTPLDADAVVWSINRYLQNRGAATQVWTNSVASVEVRDPRTLVFNLTDAWPQFPSIFTQGMGMVLAKSSDAGPTFTPIGAGPFTIERFAPNEEALLAARADYWGGRPRLDKVRFVPMGSDQARLESLASGELDMTMILQAALVAQVLKDGYPGHLASIPMGATLNINNREGRAGADVRVRQAIVAGIDLEGVNQRVDDGKRVTQSEMFPPWSALSPSVKAASFDPDKARELVAAAKADGYDGKLTYISVQSPDAQATALAVQAMLNSVGFTVDIVYPGSQTDVIKKAYVDRDFDLMSGAINASEAAPYLPLFGAFGSTSANNVMGYQNPRMDELLGELKSAQDDAAARGVVDQMQTLMNETAPLVNYGARANVVAWGKGVHDAQYSFSGIMLLDKAWMSKG